MRVDSFSKPTPEGVMTQPVMGVEIKGAASSPLLTPEALGFLAELHRRFNARRLELLKTRRERTTPFDFLTSTKAVRDGDWKIAPVPPVLADRRVEITGPTDAKMVINALNSGANVFMADFEDSTSPTWANLLGGQLALFSAV